MSDSLSNLTYLVNQIVYGTNDPAVTPAGGVMAACGLDAEHVVGERDMGERPAYPFMTFLLMQPSGEVLYGPPNNEYRSVSEDPDDVHGVLLNHTNARKRTLRLYVYGQEPDQQPEEMGALANKAQRYLESIVNRELDLLGIDARVESTGEARDASTVLNDAMEIRLGLDVTLVVGETYTVPVSTYEDLTLTLAEDSGEEEEEVIAL